MCVQYRLRNEIFASSTVSCGWEAEKDSQTLVTPGTGTANVVSDVPYDSSNQEVIRKAQTPNTNCVLLLAIQQQTRILQTNFCISIIVMWCQKPWIRVVIGIIIKLLGTRGKVPLLQKIQSNFVHNFYCEQTSLCVLTHVLFKFLHLVGNVLVSWQQPLCLFQCSQSQIILVLLTTSLHVNTTSSVTSYIMQTRLTLDLSDIKRIEKHINRQEYNFLSRH